MKCLTCNKESKDQICADCSFLEYQKKEQSVILHVKINKEIEIYRSLENDN